MKRFLFLFLFLGICRTAFCVDFNSEDITQINQKLENILRIANFLPASNKTAIQSEVKSIKKILTDKVRILKDQPLKPVNQQPVKVQEAGELKLYDEQAFKVFVSKIKAAGTYKNQAVLLKKVQQQSSFTLQQILDLTKVVTLPNDQKDVANMLLPNAVDHENIDLLYHLFSTKEEQDAINKISEDHLK